MPADRAVGSWCVTFESQKVPGSKPVEVPSFIQIFLFLTTMKVPGMGHLVGTCSYISVESPNWSTILTRKFQAVLSSMTQV